MSEKNNLTISVPQIVILGEQTDIQKITFDELNDIIDNIDLLSFGNVGLMAAKFRSLNSEYSDNVTMLCWYLNNYLFSYKLRLGKSKKNDELKIQEEIMEHLTDISLKISLDMEDEQLVNILENGFIDIKLGKKENKRLYRIFYSAQSSNVEEALKLVNSIQIMDENTTEQINILPTPNTTIH